VLAFGGNALLPDPFHPEDQKARADALALALLLLIERVGKGRGVVLVHGNGPQVGMILLRVEATRADLPPEPLDVLVAETQGSVGHLLARALQNALTEAGADMRVATVLTQVIVDSDDPGLTDPTKPIGPHYPPEQADRLREERGWQLVHETGKGWRRVVPSPRPIEVVEIDSIRDAARPGCVVIAGGGGGVPVLRHDNGALEGIEAVIDKDHTASLLARSLNASAFVVLTGVSHVSRRFGAPDEEPLYRIDVEMARDLMDAGEFPRGSMGPKMEAAALYVAATDRPALITDVDSLGRALDGDEGTWLVP
jgi:carbamate kinase